MPDGTPESYLRQPYESELAYFKENPNVAGMATEDNRIILNPYKEMSPEEAQSVIENEYARLFMRNNSDYQPDFELTPQQQVTFGDYGTLGDAMQTIAARIYSGDPSAGNVTGEQLLFTRDLAKGIKDKSKSKEEGGQSKMPEGRPQDYFVKEDDQEEFVPYSQAPNTNFQFEAPKNNPRLKGIYEKLKTVNAGYEGKLDEKDKDKDTMVAERNMAGTKIENGQPMQKNTKKLVGEPTEWDDIFIEAGEKFNIDPNLLKAIAYTESKHNPRAVSHRGAQGLMQIMPGHMQNWAGVTDPYDPRQSIMGGAKILADEMGRFPDQDLAIAAYNHGATDLINDLKGQNMDFKQAKFADIQPHLNQETAQYVPKVKEYLNTTNSGDYFVKE